jgi:azurin
MKTVPRHVCQIFVVFLLVGIGPVAGQSPDVPAVEIQVGDNMKFTPSVINARPGERVRVVIKGVGTVPKASMSHTFVLLKSGTNPKTFVDKSSRARETDFIDPALREQVIVASSPVGPGEAIEVTFEAPAKAGEYTFVCTFPSHFKLGMKGQLIVK